MARMSNAAFGALALLAGLVAGMGPAVGQHLSGGVVKLWGGVNTVSTTLPSAVLITGVIGDHGFTIAVDRNDKPDNSGSFVRVRLTKGDFTVDTAKLNAAFAKATPTDFNPSNCSGSVTVGPVTLPIVSGSGTGSYAKIRGSLTLTAQVALIAPKAESGSCNLNASPVAGWGGITGTGRVSFA